MKRWDGSKDTNWTDIDNFLEGGLPGGAEDVVVLSSAQNSILDNITQPASAKLGNIIIEKGCPKSFGLDATTPFNRSCASILHQGGEGSKLFFKDGDQTTDRVIIDSDNVVDAARLDGDTITYVELLKGGIIFADSLTNIAQLIIAYRNAEDDVSLSMEDGVGTITTAFQLAGSVTSRAAITGLYQLGGIFSQIKNAISALILHGGVHNYDVSDTLILTMLTGGLLELNNTGVTKTLTDLWVLPGGHVNKNALTTITNEYLLPGGKITQEEQ